MFKQHNIVDSLAGIWLVAKLIHVRSESRYFSLAQYNSYRSECLCTNAQAEPTTITVDVDHGLDKSFRPDYCLHHFDSTAADLGPDFAKYL